MRTTIDDEQPSVQTGSDIKLSSYSSYNKTEVGEVTPKTRCAIASKLRATELYERFQRRARGVGL